MLAEAREVNADGGIAAGIFIPVPFHFARLFPDKSEYDDSVPHFTLLYIGDITPEQQATVVDAVREVARDWSPFRMDMLRYHEFTNKDGKTIAHMVGSATLARPGGDVGPIYRGLGSLHADLFAAIEATGILVGHTYGHLDGTIGFSDRADAFTPHATLAYAEPGAHYDGPKPRGSWTVKDIEVWGHERYQIPLGKTTTDQPVEWREKKDSLYTRVVSDTANDEIELSLYERLFIVPAVAEWLSEWLDEAKRESAFKDFYDVIRKTMLKLTGKKVRIAFPHWDDRGFEATFREGGKLTIQRIGDAHVAKMHGLPTAASFFRGEGLSPYAALSTMRPEFEEPTPVPVPARERLDDILHGIRAKGPIPRTVGGGVVVRDFSGKDSVLDIEILVAKSHKKWGGEWLLPGGGADVGEHIHDTAAREVGEETGVVAKVVDADPYTQIKMYDGRGDSDLPTILAALKAAYPDEVDLIDAMEADIGREKFVWKNTISYFLMQHVRGDPISEPEASEEMGEARWVTVRDALRLNTKVGDIVRGLIPALAKQSRLPEEYPPPRPREPATLAARVRAARSAESFAAESNNGLSEQQTAKPTGEMKALLLALAKSKSGFGNFTSETYIGQTRSSVWVGEPVENSFRGRTARGLESRGLVQFVGVKEHTERAYRGYEQRTTADGRVTLTDAGKTLAASLAKD